MEVGITGHWRLALAALSAFAPAACGQSDSRAQRSSPPQQVEPAALESGAVLALRPKEETGIRGTAEFSFGLDSTIVELMLTGLKPGASYPAHVHEGRCDDPGTVLLSLQSVIGGRDGVGYSVSTVSTGLLERAERGDRLLIQAHLTDGTPAACVDLSPVEVVE